VASELLLLLLMLLLALTSLSFTHQRRYWRLIRCVMHQRLVDLAARDIPTGSGIKLI